MTTPKEPRPTIHRCPHVAKGNRTELVLRAERKPGDGPLVLERTFALCERCEARAVELLLGIATA